MKNPIKIDDDMLCKILDSKTEEQLKTIQKFIEFRIDALVFKKYLQRDGHVLGSEGVLDIDLLNLTTYSHLNALTYNILSKLKLRTLRQIKEYGRDNLVQTPGVGKAILKQLQEEFEWWGHQL